MNRVKKWVYGASHQLAIADTLAQLNRHGPQRVISAVCVQLHALAQPADVAWRGGGLGGRSPDLALGAARTTAPRAGRSSAASTSGGCPVATTARTHVAGPSC